MDAVEHYAALGVALGVGLLIGMERQQSASDEGEDAGYLAGGIRTYALFAMCGAAATLISESAGGWFVGVVLAGLMTFLAIAYSDDVRKGRERGMTSETAFVITFLLGALAPAQGVIEPYGRRLMIVAGGAVAVTLLLSSKPILHKLASRVSTQDIFATLKFLVVAVIVLPLLPNETYGPLEVINPFQVGLMVVLIAGLSFVGYASIRALGAERGLGLTGLVGGLVSSTAVTLAVSARAKETPQVAGPCLLALLLASAVMFVRVLIEVAAVNAELLPQVLLPIGAMGVTGLSICGVVYWRGRSRDRSTEERADIEVDNPFELGSAIKFGLLFAIVLFVAKAASVYMGSGGAYLTALLAGLTDVDAITLSMASLAKSDLEPSIAATSIVIANAANTLVKGGMAVVLGGPAFGRKVVLAFLVMLAAGAIGVAVMWLSV
jgi:uncharacterized membrane protein (DUF4010 family)